MFETVHRKTRSFGAKLTLILVSACLLLDHARAAVVVNIQLSDLIVGASGANPDPNNPGYIIPINDSQRQQGASNSGSLSASAAGTAGSGNSSASFNVTSNGAYAFAQASHNGIGGAFSSAYVAVGFSSSEGKPIRGKYALGSSRTGNSSGNTLPLSGIINAFANSGNIGSESRSAAYVWTDGDFFPGENPDDPKDYEDDPGNDGDVEIVGGVDIANDVTGAYLTSLPVDASYGVSSPVYFGESTGVSPSVDLGARGYVFLLQSGLNFTSFTTPNGIPGDTTGAYLAFGTTTTPYVPGTTYTFSSPVGGFAILGLDPTALYTDSSAPFVQGFTFDQSGPAIFTQYVVAVPEVGTLTLTFLGASIGVIASVRRRYKRE